MQQDHTQRFIAFHVQVNEDLTADEIKDGMRVFPLGGPFADMAGFDPKTATGAVVTARYCTTDGPRGSGYCLICGRKVATGAASAM